MYSGIEILGNSKPNILILIVTLQCIKSEDWRLVRVHTDLGIIIKGNNFDP